MNSGRFWRSLQARLAVGGLIWVCLGVSLSGAAISKLLDEHVTQQFDHEITDHLTELQGLYAASRSPDDLLRPVSDPRFGVPDSGYYWEIWRNGAPVLRSPSLTGKNIRLPKDSDEYARAVVQGTSQRLVYVREERPAGEPGGPALYAVGVDEAQLKSILADFQKPLFGSLIVVAVGLCLASAAQVVFGLRPLRKMRAALAQVRAGTAEALPEDFPSEVQPLVSDLNEVIRVNREMIQRARAQAGNLAHGLRTPLSILSCEAERLALEGKGEAAEAILQECREMRRQIDHQIARARAAANRTIAGPQVMAAPIVGEVVVALSRLYRDRNVIFTNDVPSDLTVACDPEDLKEIFGNLLDNAGKWAAGRVSVSGQMSGGLARFFVVDDGPGIPEAKRHAVFNLGERLDERPSGSGLGLTIVRDLMALYNGEIRLGASPTGGLSVALTLHCR